MEAAEECSNKFNVSLIDNVISWSLKDVLTEELFKPQVVDIPLSFRSKDHYFESFKWALLEETRALLSANVRHTERAPFAGVTSLRRSALDGGFSTYDIDIDYWRSTIGETAFTLSSGDIFVLTDSIAEEVSEFEVEGRAWVFASVVRVDENGISFAVKVSKSIESYKFVSNTPLFAVFLANIRTNERVWNAMRMHGNTSIIENVLRPEVDEKIGLFSESHSCCSAGLIDANLPLKLDKSQSKAVLASVCSIRCNDKPCSVELVWGPPGTGKTRTLSTLLFIILSRMERKTLVCASSSAAITGTARSFLNVVKELSAVESVDNVLFFGDKDHHQVKADPEIEEILLSSRAAWVLDGFQPFKDWRRSFTSAIGFLRDCVSESTREGFASSVVSLRSFIAMFRSRFPRNSVTRHVFAAMDALGSFGTLSSHQNELDSINSMEVLSMLKDLLCRLDELIPDVINKSTVEELCIRVSTLIFCTASSSYELYQVRMKPISVLVIDEAQQLKECESAIPLQLPGLERAFLFGDQRQIPANSLTSKIAVESGLGRSLFERLSLNGYPKQFLDTQYRMHPLISLFPRTKFYNNPISDAPNARDRSYSKSYLPGPLFGPYSFINISCGNEDMDDIRYSRKNIVEVAVATKIVHNLYKAWKAIKQKISICLTSPYTAQVIEIQEKLGQNYNGLDGFMVEVMRVDELQGKEVDIVILSTVRSNSDGSVGYLSNLQMTNLVLTRARHCLWILGHERTLCKGESVWKDIISNAKDRRLFFNVEEDDDMAEFVVEVKKDLDQLDQLLVADTFLFSNTRWKVLFSNNFKKSFVKIKSPHQKKSVIYLLLKLANGWRPKRRNVNVTCERSRHVLKQFKVKDLYVVCSVDIVKEYSYVQVLRVWDLLPLRDTPVLVKRLDTVFVAYTDNFLNLCKAKCIEGDLEIPMSWEKSCNVARYKKSCKAGRKAVWFGGDETCNDSNLLEEDSKVSESLLVMKFYALSSGMVGQLLSSCVGTELELPFELTSQEFEIIQSDQSSFILGRSGTGKTTVLIRKLFQREQLYHIASRGYHEDDECRSKLIVTERGDMVEEIDETFLRQIFVTNNPRLCFAVKQHVSGLKRFANHGISEEDCNVIPLDYIDDLSFRDIPDSFVDLPRKAYPLVITFHKFLMMLDGTLGDSFFDKFPESRGRSLRNSKRRRESMALETFIRTKGVGFEKFRSSYWPHFTMDLTRGLEPLRVFSEIMSHIKDGLKRGNLHNERLSRKEYFLHCRSRVSSLSVQESEKVYDIFLQYEEKKMENSEYDLADLVTDLHRRLKDQGYRGDEMDLVYIDEVQDMTMAQIALFKYICRNVNGGFVFAGDTAQTIAKGIDFRFEDIRCLFYREFVLKSELGRTYRKGEKGLVADAFHLSQNFRTHARILRLAQSVTDLLCRFFPRSIDVLSPETSLIDGETPLLVEYAGSENTFSSMFSNAQDDNRKNNLVGFGAEQVILVRDDKVKKKILNSIGNQALVLTIEECKGLEFEDVMLFNFLSSSPAKNEWRVMLEYMNDQALLLRENPTESFPVFCETKHRVLCTELKQLYVAITRTRQRLWIFENTDELHECILHDYWKRLEIVEARRFDDALVKEIQVSSTREEWMSRGIKLFHAKNYGPAKMCFQKARDAFWEKQAEAAGLRFTAQQIIGSNPLIAHAYLKKGAEIFASIGKYEQAAQCYFDSKEYEEAGVIYWEKFGNAKLAEAGECFTRAGCYKRAAAVYAKGNFHCDCLDACSRGKLHEKGFSYIMSWKHEAASDDNMLRRYKEEIEAAAQGFLENSALSYGRLGDHTTMMKYVRSFHSKDSMRKFLDDFSFFDELLRLETEWGCFLNAAISAKKIGKTLLAAQLLEKANHFEEASMVVLCYVLANSLWANGTLGWPLKPFREKNELLDKARALARNVSSEFFDLVSMEAEILTDKRVPLFALKKLLSDSKRYSSVRGGILCTRKILDYHFSLHESIYTWRDDVEGSNPSGDQVCIDTLLHFWDVWKEKIVKILACLGSGQLGNETNVFWKSSLDYLGVTATKESRNSRDVIIFNPIVSDACWVKKIDERNLHQHGKSVGLRENQISQASRSVWTSEILSVGNKVLEKLKCLYNFSKQKSMPLHFQVKTLVHMIEVSKFLIGYKLSLGYHYKMLDFSADHLLGDLFPMEWRTVSTLQMTNLRATEKLRDVLDEIVCRRIRSKNRLTYEKIGDVVTAAFGSSGKLCDKTYEQLCLRLLDGYPLWASCIESLRSLVSENPEDFDPRIHVSAALALHEALRNTYYDASFGESESMSPTCFVYLVERLINMMFCFKERFFSTKSTFLEWLINRDWNSNGVVDFEGHDCLSVFVDALEFVAGAIAKLLRNKRDVSTWIKNSKLGPKCHRLLVCRLFVALCLLCVNSGKYYGLLFELLDEPEITSQLPREFYNVIRKLKYENVDGHNVDVLSYAFKKIQNPLVVVISSGKSCVGSKFTNAIVVDLKARQGRETLIDIMFRH